MSVEHMPGDCGYCGEELDPKEECLCNGDGKCGSDLCDCEFMHHHIGCCSSYTEG